MNCQKVDRKKKEIEKERPVREERVERRKQEKKGDGNRGGQKKWDGYKGRNKGMGGGGGRGKEVKREREMTPGQSFILPWKLII